MIIDNNLRVSNAQTVTSTAVSTDSIDLSQARDIGEGQDLFMHFTVTEAVTAAGAATVEFQVIGSANSNLSSGVVIGSSGPIGKASLIVGARVAVRINPQIGSNAYRYLGANYSVATGPLTAGKFTADVVYDIQDNKVYSSGFAIL